MTTEEFYAALAQKTRETGTVWVRIGGFVRVDLGSAAETPHCPLSFVAGTEPGTIRASAATLGLDVCQAYEIAFAADGFEKTPPADLVDLLHACGLEA